MMFLPFFTYAELHYRVIPFFYSKIFKKEPEIIVDVPWRLQKSLFLPLLLYVKDAHLYPVLIEKLQVEIFLRKKSTQIFNKTIAINERIILKKWWRIIEVELPDCTKDSVIETRVKIDYVNQTNHKKQCVNDNYPLKTPSLITFCTPYSLLASEDLGWISADLHVHTSYTEDQIEFGAPLRATAKMAKAIGLDAIGVSDHAYDLDDSLDDYLKNSSDLPKWREFLKESAELNKNDNLSPAIVQGQEATVNRLKGKRNIHLQIFGSKKLYASNSDSGEKWFSFLGKHKRIDEIVDALPSDVFSCAAHIGEKPPFFHRLLLGRSSYSLNEILLPGLDAAQIYNGNGNRFNRAGLALWVRALLKGKKLTPLAGSDSHGNFATARYILLPHFSIRISRKQLLGDVRTLVYLPDAVSPLTSEQIIKVLKSGNVQVSNGPMINFSLKEDQKNESLFGKTFSIDEFKNLKFSLGIFSNQELGSLAMLRIYAGNGKKQKETVFFEESFEPDTYYSVIEPDFRSLDSHTLYIRFEVKTEFEAESISSPVYFQGEID